MPTRPKQGPCPRALLGCLLSFKRKVNSIIPLVKILEGKNTLVVTYGGGKMNIVRSRKNVKAFFFCTPPSIPNFQALRRGRRQHGGSRSYAVCFLLRKVSSQDPSGNQHVRSNPRSTEDEHSLVKEKT